MPISITFGDFDTVCYSNQHNIIQLIKSAVGFSVEINVVSGKVDKVEQDVSNLETEVDSSIGHLNNIQHEVNENTTDITQLRREFDAYTQGASMDFDNINGSLRQLKSQVEDLFRIVADLDDRITALGG